MGITEGVDYLTLNHDETLKTILKVLKDSSYALNAQKWSKRFRDQKEAPLERAIWWMEWLIRNPDCDYLKSPTHRLGFISANIYDIIAVITIISSLLVIILLKLFYNCVRKYCQFNHSKRFHKKVE